MVVEFPYLEYNAGCVSYLEENDMFSDLKCEIGKRQNSTWLRTELNSKY